MELPPRTLLIQETPSTLYDWSPTKILTDGEPPQLCMMPVRNYENTYLDDQVAQQTQKKYVSKINLSSSSDWLKDKIFWNE